MAPTKSLCSERTKDWDKKFKPLDISCKLYIYLSIYYQQMLYVFSKTGINYHIIYYYQYCYKVKNLLGIQIMQPLIPSQRVILCKNFFTFIFITIILTIEIMYGVLSTVTVIVVIKKRNTNDFILNYIYIICDIIQCNHSRKMGFYDSTMDRLQRNDEIYYSFCGNNNNSI